LWDNQSKAQEILKERSSLKDKIDNYENLQEQAKTFYELAKMAYDENDEASEAEIEKELKALLKIAKFSVTESLFSGKFDHENCFLEINSGAGGTESQDFAQMLLRMYLRFCERLKMKAEIVSLIDGEEAGIKSCSIRIEGKSAYGWFRTESGVHRLVRISPFNSQGKRMTSFASAWVYPELSDDIDIVVDEKDLRIDTYRASGAGGQHINKTDSAVRITHMPSGIVVQCQSDRSQHKNKDRAMKMLKSRLYELERQKKEAELLNIAATKSENGWGSQIRSYVLQPYQMVKDLRTDHETSDTQKVLDGDLEQFVYASLSAKL
jgi:peptide chain release factor 2